MNSTTERTITATIYTSVVHASHVIAGATREGTHRVEQRRTLEGTAALWRSVYEAQDAGHYVRTDFGASVALIEAGAFGVPWVILRREAVEELNALHEGSGCGISSSDVNHTVVGLVQGRRVLEPVA